MHQFESLFIRNPMPMWVYDLATLRFLVVNEAAIRLYGHTKEEFAEMTIADIRPPEDVPALHQEIDQIRNGDPHEPKRTWRHRAKDGQLIYVEVTVETQSFEGHDTRLVMVQNVTEQVQSQKLLALQKDILENTAKNVSTDFICGELCKGMEVLNPEIRCAIMRHDLGQHRLSLFCAPNLPENFKREIGHSFRQPDSAPWSKAVRSSQTEGFADIDITDEYPEVQPFLAAFKLRSCWAVPVLSAKQEVTALFCIYANEPHTLTGFESDCVGIATNLISIVTERDKSKMQLTQFFYDTLEARRAVEEERLRNLETVQQSEERFRKLAENSPDIVFVEQLPEQELIYLNRENILGHPAKKFMPFSTIHEWFVHEEDVFKLQELRQKIAKTNSPDHYNVELRVYNAKKQIEWVSGRVVVMSRHPDGSVSQILVNVTVITEQKQIQYSIEKDKANLEALIENTSDGIWVVNRKYEIMIMNTSLQRTCLLLLGTQLELGRDMLDQFPPDMREPWKMLYEKAFKGDRYRKEMHFHLQDRDLYYEISFNPIHNKAGDVEGASVFARNITSKKIAADELVKANFELDSFVYRSSHDLRAPLRSVLGLINLVRLEDDAQQQDNYLNLIEKSVNRLDNFINDLTHFSRNSRMSIERLKVDFKAILDESIENLRYMENASQVEVRVNITQDCDFFSDSSRISIILHNLLSNSVKYQRIASGDSFVTANIHVTAQNATITVTDNGMGIEAEYLPKIFDMFFRASANSYGSGLGLYITKQAVEKLMGTLHVESKVNAGTTFTITLPNLPMET